MALTLLEAVYQGQEPPGWPSLLGPFAAYAMGAAALYPLAACLEGGERHARAGRFLAALAVLLTWLLSAPALRESPALALVAFLAGGSLIAWSRLERLHRHGVPGGRPAPRQASHEAASLVVGAATVGLLGWFLAVPAGLARSSLGWGALASAQLLPLALGVRWSWPTRAARRARFLTLSGSTTLACLAALALTLRSPSLASLPLLAAVALHGFVARRRLAERWDQESWWEPLFHEPARMLVSTFLAGGIAGGVVLSLPAASTHAVAPLDAFFSSFSAICVTGLSTLDTPHDFGFFGQAVLLVLIQVGGLGIMTFSTAALVFFGRRMSLRHESAVSQLLSAEDRGDLRSAVLQVFTITLGTEALGALALSALFAADEPLLSACWRGLFTSVSAVCNAGFALQSESLLPYQGSPAVLHVIALLILIGGLGPMTIVLLPRILRRRPASAQAKLILAASLLLTVLPAVFVAVVEWDYGLASIPGSFDKLTNAWFQSVTLRTAGFNSIDLTALRPATLTLMIALMFIGGSPGSTAGGIKTTTAALVLLTSWSAIRGRGSVEVFGVRIAHASIYKTVAVVALGALSVLAALIGLQLTQEIPLTSLLFEAVSALATVGLTLGATGELDSVGKVIVIACMFAGRVGPLTVFMVLARRERSSPWSHPEQDIAIG